MHSISNQVQSQSEFSDRNVERLGGKVASNSSGPVSKIWPPKPRSVPKRILRELEYRNSLLGKLKHFIKLEVLVVNEDSEPCNEGDSLGVYELIEENEEVDEEDIDDPKFEEQKPRSFVVSVE